LYVKLLRVATAYTSNMVAVTEGHNRHSTYNRFFLSS